jgi:maltose alpha-D-glucosyltransferase/alpha-amylase
MPGAPAWDAARSRVGSAEQSNTSIVYDDRAILKLFRRLETGENPDVEISRFLATRTSFRNTPALYGVVRLTRAGATSVAGMASEFLPGSADAWSHALERVRAYLGASRQAEPANAFADEMRELARATRALHEALASHPDDPAFPAMPITGDDFHAWAEATRASITRGLDLLEAQVSRGALGGQTLAIAQATLRRREQVMARVTETLADPRSARDPGRTIRHHGDYHLGQVLRTHDGRWMIIDFEGEPARPLEDRRAPSSPLRDVAGMLRSFAYAAATGAMAAGGLGRDPVVETRAARWERDARAAFLAGYLEAPATALTPVPVGDRDYVDGLVTLFEIEKVFYELAYELDNRPDWVWIPLRGIAKLF